MSDEYMPALRLGAPSIGRCPECGQACRELPCKLCIARSYEGELEEMGPDTMLPPLSECAGLIPFDFEPEEHTRYLQVRRVGKKDRGDPKLDDCSSGRVYNVRDLRIRRA